jgi:GntR family histidine utilization transcriptional repressor
MNSMSAIESTAAAPQYLKVKNHLREGISAGRWVAGDLLPSEAELVEHFGLSRMTVNRAFRELHQDGLIERVQGVGSFVAQLDRISSTLTVRDLHEEIRERGHQFQSQVMSLQTLKANADQAKAFGVRVGTTLFHSLIKHLENGRAIQYEDRLVNPACAPDYLSQDFSQITPTQYLLEVAPLSEARYMIEAMAPTPEEADALGIGKREPCLVVRRITFSRGRAVTMVKLTHPGTLYSLTGSFKT